MPVRISPPVSPRTIRNYVDADDEQLMILVQHNDQKAFAELIYRHHGLMHKLVRKFFGAHTDAEDMIQDIALTVWQRRGTWQAGLARFSTWLYTITSNRCIDRLRKKHEDHDTDKVMEFYQDDAPDGFDNVAQRQVDAELKNLLAQLPVQQKLALEMFYYHDADINEICHQMKASESAVRSYLKRGKQNLRARISA